MHYISLVIDKSAFQQLNLREAEWLFHYFRVNFPPVFFAEVIADLTKQRPTTASAEGDVQMLARKIVSSSININAGSMHLVISELHAGGPTPMKGVSIDERAERVTSEDGRKGLFIDQGPTQDMIARWAEGDFSQLERDNARVWREGISGFKLEEVFRGLKRPSSQKFTTHAQIAHYVDTEILAPGRDFALITGAAAAFGTQDRVIRGMVQAWKRHNRPAFAKFLPYTYYCLRLELYFLTGLAHQVVSTRDSNRIDMEYFKYLPFTRVFASSDALHIAGYDQFAMPFNRFVSGAGLKSALREIADHWEGLPEDEKSSGSANYAGYPPLTLDNAVTRVYNQVIPKWREHAVEPQINITPEMNEKLMAHLKPMMDAIEKQRKK